MSTTPVIPRAVIRASVPVGGTPLIIASGAMLGGMITNPLLPEDQGLDEVEDLFIDIVGSASLMETATTFVLAPGQPFFIPPGFVGLVSVNAASSGHQFSGYVLRSAVPPVPIRTPQQGTFPPDGATTVTLTSLSYLYEQYQDDEDLQAFVRAYNVMTQQYVTWFATIGLPIYTGDQIVGPLLDWVARGLYGFIRPTLGSGRNRDAGPYNTAYLNQLAYNQRLRIGPANVTATNDDVFKRCITWNFYKGDGGTFNVRWLKRRIMRFLIGTNGTAPPIDNTYPISITFGSGGLVSIRISTGTRAMLRGPYARVFFNELPYNGAVTLFTSAAEPFVYESVLKEAINSGALQLPFQSDFRVAV